MSKKMKKHNEEFGPFAELADLLLAAERALRGVAPLPVSLSRVSEPTLRDLRHRLECIRSSLRDAMLDPLHRRRIDVGRRCWVLLMPWTKTARAAAAARRLESRFSASVARFDTIADAIAEELARRWRATGSAAFLSAHAAAAKAAEAAASSAAAGGSGGRGRGGRGAAQAHVPPALPSLALQLEDDGAEQKRLAALEPEPLAGLSSSSSAEDVLAFLALDEPQPSRDRQRG